MKDKKLPIPAILVILFFGYMIYTGIISYGNKKHREGLDLGATMLYGQVNEDLKKHLQLYYNVEQRNFEAYKKILEEEK